ncbi:thiosulfate sulfurtransferase isoform X2 [Aplysia californica]|uniref:Thiosulfate sulfurtransferase isoform X2 n=1 Tax=Aplysia californica TaxID=6500 RepID=A0ABM1A1B1_APLCA|nr:thiosulfate sulfurtransferase isoform X2 [Aplysia californica]
MTINRLPTLVSTTWLKQQMCRHSNPSIAGKITLRRSLRILDTSWTPEPEVDGYKTFFKEAHIPSSLYFDLKQVQTSGQKGPGAKFPIPDSNRFQDYVEDLGISNDTHVIAYDRFNSRPSFRTWFLFRLFGHDKVSVLNGGLRQWVTDGYHVTVDEPDVEEGEFEVNFRPHLLRSYDEMLKNVNSQAEQVVDARGRGNFVGENENDGHIPGSKNIPFGSVFNDDGTVKSSSELQKLFDNVGIDLSKPLVSTCQTGMTACAVAAAAHILGKEDVPVYNNCDPCCRL